MTNKKIRLAAQGVTEAVCRQNVASVYFAPSLGRYVVPTASRRVADGYLTLDELNAVIEACRPLRAERFMSKDREPWIWFTHPDWHGAAVPPWAAFRGWDRPELPATLAKPIAGAGDGYRLESGEIVPWGAWRDVGGDAFSICPYVTRAGSGVARFQIRRNATGEIAKPGAALQAAQDALMMGLYRDRLPEGYIAYAFGAAALDDVGAAA